MPKIVENLRERILDVARKQIVENGYSNVTMRSIAKDCNIGLGTIYNYFDSKDVIVANYMMEDWRICLVKINNEIINDKPRLEAIYCGLINFIDDHNKLFSDVNAEISYATNVIKWHPIFRSQIAKLVLELCHDDVFLSEFIAESLISWAIEKKKYSSLSPILEKLLK